MKKSLITAIALAAVGSFLVVGSAFSCPITGGISMKGTYTPVDDVLSEGAYSSTTIPLATGIDFGRWYDGAHDSTFLVNTATGYFSRFANNINRIIDYFQFVTFAPVTPLWSVGRFSFAMTTFSYEKSTSGGGSHLIDFYGTGALSVNVPTPGTLSFTGQGTQDANLSSSASVATSPVPEPATMLLFGTGLAGLAGVARRKKKD